MQAWSGGRIERRGWQQIPQVMAELGLTAADGMAQVWFVDARGRLSGGAAAANRALACCWWARPLTYLYAVPGLRQVQDRVYHWVADNRNRMPGSTPACSLPVDPKTPEP